jgi:hypothetical protein
MYSKSIVKNNHYLAHCEVDNETEDSYDEIYLYRCYIYAGATLVSPILTETTCQEMWVKHLAQFAGLLGHNVSLSRHINKCVIRPIHVGTMTVAPEDAQRCRVSSLLAEPLIAESSDESEIPGVNEINNV